MPPDEFTQAGTYDVYITGRETLLTIASVSTSFIMQTAPSPPQAAFTYYPPTLYANMSATFDASSSSAEGFNDTITRYEWYFDDPNDPELVINDGSNPLAFHTFEFGGTYLVSLNVTDNEGLWSYTVKPILIYPEYGPTANFTWAPSQPRVNGTTTFNATTSEPGWSAATADFSPIVQYKWNFDDGTGNITIPSNPVIAHIYTQPGNYSVMLEVTDSMGRSDAIIRDLEVSIITGNLYDINGDGYVGIDDIVIVAEKFGTQVGDPDWDPRCDVTGDDYVGIDDIVLVAEHFGETD
jgi:PKD repeat protein